MKSVVVEAVLTDCFGLLRGSHQLEKGRSVFRFCRAVISLLGAILGGRAPVDGRLVTGSGNFLLGGRAPSAVAGAFSVDSGGAVQS
jgi:hypothetical protein